MDLLPIKRRLRDDLYQRQGLSIVNLPEDKRPEAFLESIDLKGRLTGAQARVTTGTRKRGEPYPNGWKPPSNQEADYCYWVALDGQMILHQTGQSPYAGGRLTEDNLEEARKAHERAHAFDLLMADLVEEYIDFATGL